MNKLAPVLRLSAVVAALILVGISCREELPTTPVAAPVASALYPTGIKGEPKIRVLAAARLAHAELAVSGTYSLQFTSPNGEVTTGVGDRSVTVLVDQVGADVKVGKAVLAEAVVRPRAGTLVRLRYSDAKGRACEFCTRHPLTLVSGGADSGFMAVVSLGMEEYLIGVVPAEMPSGWPLEALKAQAVASRTYALYKIRTRPSKTYDVSATESDQVWKPGDKPNLRAALAVNSTRGLVMLDGGRIFPAFFHSKCGGFTDSANGSLLQQDIKALWSVRCPYCYESKEDIGSWKLTLKKSELAKLLPPPVPGKIDRLRALDVDGQPLSAMGRVRTVEVIFANGASRRIAALDFRRLVDGDNRKIANTWFAITDGPGLDAVTFEGKGLGHGVGMCQWGAQYCAAKLKWSYADILNRYYTGNAIVRLWGSDNPGTDEEPAPAGE